MSKLLIFGGTTEGRLLAEFCEKEGIDAFVSVAGEYGESLIRNCRHIEVLTGKRDERDMLSFIRQESISFVLDATHPHAALATSNIRRACDEAGVSYTRVLRDQAVAGTGLNYCVHVTDVGEAVSYLQKKEGNILLTVGAKEIVRYIPLGPERLFVRVLPSLDSIGALLAAGIPGGHIIGMQGPFHKDLNIALLRQFKCQYLVTKESGREGGFSEKAKACQELGVEAVIIGRPREEEGISLKEAKEKILSFFSGKGEAGHRKKRITIGGIGPGHGDFFPYGLVQDICQADAIIGEERMLQAARLLRLKQGLALPAEHHAYQREAILSLLREESGENIVVLVSGDSSFYSGAKGLFAEIREAFSDGEVRMLSGISSASYLAGKMGIPLESLAFSSLHGREEKGGELLALLKRNSGVFILTEGKEQVNRFLRTMTAGGMGDFFVTVGENLSYSDEAVFRDRARQLQNRSYGPLVCLLIENTSAVIGHWGIEDEKFIRGKVPMTKEEIRILSLASFRMAENSICFDIGAGTGSVSIELARMAFRGTVYAIEKKEEAVSLLWENKKAFHAYNMEIIHAAAPDCLDALPAPDIVFIGGSGGALPEIVSRLYERNPRLQLVINAITMETIAVMQGILRDFEEKGYETKELMVNIAKSKKAGEYHLMMAHNPVYIGRIRIRDEEDARG